MSQKHAPSLIHVLLFISLLLSFSTHAKADVSITGPIRGGSYSAISGSVNVRIAWEESESEPLLADIKSYTFVLCSGPNAGIVAVKTLEQLDASEIKDYSYTASIDATVGSSGNYYIQVYATSENGFSIHYTNRFSLTDMTGTFQPSGNDASPPESQVSLNSNAENTVGVESASFDVPYALQTGPIRYAPMQMQPGTSVTKSKKSWTRQYPVSSVTYFKTIRRSLDQISTATPGWSYTMMSAVNWASPAPNPSLWYPATARYTKSPTKKAWPTPATTEK